MELPQVVVLHNKYSKKSREFLAQVPNNIYKLDCFGESNPITGEFWIDGMEYQSNNGIISVRALPAVIIQVPAYHDDIQEKNIDAYQHLLEWESDSYFDMVSPQSFNNWGDIVDFVDFVNQRAIDNPLLS